MIKTIATVAQSTQKLKKYSVPSVSPWQKNQQFPPFGDGNPAPCFFRGRGLLFCCNFPQTADLSFLRRQESPSATAINPVVKYSHLWFRFTKTDHNSVSIYDCKQLKNMYLRKGIFVGTISE
ncbi:MAG: hypothetical protein H6629_09060 [Calditrichae bacterium]|nr:hypothetical protein [Calditrichia bacterium]